jgi:hypothetical protein
MVRFASFSNLNLIDPESVSQTPPFPSNVTKNMETKHSQPSCDINTYYFYEYKYYMCEVMISIK